MDQMLVYLWLFGVPPWSFLRQLHHIAFSAAVPLSPSSSVPISHFPFLKVILEMGVEWYLIVVLSYCWHVFILRVMLTFPCMASVWLDIYPSSALSYISVPLHQLLPPLSLAVALLLQFLCWSSDKSSFSRAKGTPFYAKHWSWYPLVFVPGSCPWKISSEKPWPSDPHPKVYSHGPLFVMMWLTTFFFFWLLWPA